MMISRWRWLWGRLTETLWVRATLFALAGVATALLGLLAETFVPEEIEDLISADAVGTLLNVLASGMLAVTTFTLGVMISAYSAATSNVTPRATRLLRRDSTSQNVLSTFIGSFLFSLVGIITLTIEGYGERGRVVLFVATIAVIGLVVVAILRWIEHVNGLGRVGETTSLVEKVTFRALEARRKAPYLGGRPLLDATRQVPPGAVRIHPERVGYVQHIDVGALQAWAERHEAQIQLAMLPGALVHPSAPIGWVTAGGDVDIEAREEALRGAITIDEERTYEQDPRFGLVVLSEIASRALSPGINDPGTAIDVIGRQLRLLTAWASLGETEAEETEIRCPRIAVPPLSDDDMFEDAFTAIARDGAGLAEVHIRLQKALGVLSGLGDARFRLAARRQSRDALARAEAALSFAPDIERVRKFVVPEA
jgi:uncharacterized membrane protein